MRLIPGLFFWGSAIAYDDIIIILDRRAVRHGSADSDHESDRSARTRVHTEAGQRGGKAK